LIAEKFNLPDGTRRSTKPVFQWTVTVPPAQLHVPSSPKELVAVLSDLNTVTVSAG
jgi:hypothetical protein